MNWYHKNGLVIDEDTGRNVAVAFDTKDAPLLAAAPRLLAALGHVLKCVGDGDINSMDFNEYRAAVAAARETLCVNPS